MRENRHLTLKNPTSSSYGSMTCAIIIVPKPQILGFLS